MGGHELRDPVYGTREVITALSGVKPSEPASGAPGNRNVVVELWDLQRDL
jgi:hypothetical protein